ncbi:MAG: hypothetical protein LBO66_03160, partial [Deltaproteobacteria bacterium]|nr:hypothetical protein [Deltaproteobacteria bacterium]
SDEKLPKISLALFKFDGNMAILACPRGRKAETTVLETKNGPKFRAEFKRSVCWPALKKMIVLPSSLSPARF